MLALVLLGLTCVACAATKPEPADPPRSRSERQYVELIEKLAAERQAERPAAAAAAREFLSGHPDLSTGSEMADELRVEAEWHIEALTASRTVEFRATGPHSRPLPYVLATMAGETGAPVRGLYDTRIELDAEGRGKIENVPPGVYSLRLHTLREFRSEEGYDLVAVHRLDLTVKDASFQSRLMPGGRFSVSLDSPARLVISDDFHHPVATTIWRGEQGGWTTEFAPLTPPFTSCVLPAGTYRVEAIRYRKMIAGGEVTVVPETLTTLRLIVAR